VKPLSPELLTQIRKVAQALPPAMLKTVIEYLTEANVKCDEGSLGKQVCQKLPNSHWRQDIIDLLALWQAHHHSNFFALATVLSVAAYCETESRQELSLELVWTGPNPQESPLRRTDQALLS